MLEYLLLGSAQIAGLLLIPYGAPGAWIQLAALAFYGWSTEFSVVGAVPLLILFSLLLAAEGTHAILAEGEVDPHLRRRIGFAGIAAGGFGAILGIPFPLVGSLFGAAVCALVGTALATLFARRALAVHGSIVALIVSTSIRATTGIVLATFTILALI